MFEKMKAFVNGALLVLRQNRRNDDKAIVVSSDGLSWEGKGRE